MKIESEGKLLGREKERKTKLSKSISFKQWCYDNLSKEDADEILLRWDYNLNKLSPEDVSFGSAGFNKKGYWFKCVDYPNHISEQKNIGSFTSGLGSIQCKQCNSISITHPHLVKYFVNIEDTLKYSKGSETNIPMKCPECGFEKGIAIYSLINQGFSCPRCANGYYPEKFIFSLLEQLNVIFKTQLSKATFSWCNKYKYDNYIDELKCIIETHGEQHYKENMDWGSLSKIQENDKYKKKIAKENGIDNYVVLNCRYSNMEWIRNNIMQSILPQLLNFKEDDIDWLKCHEFSCTSLIRVVCDLWNSGIKNKSQIGKKLKLSRSTVLIYLKQGAELGWCKYNIEEENKKSIISGHEKKCRQVICLTTGEVFNSQLEAEKLYGVSKGNISVCCRDNIKHKSAGKHPITNEKLVWMYYDEYLLKRKEDSN